jgi:hypothetical protein
MEVDKEKASRLTPQQEDYLELENTCCLCGTELEFQHMQDECAYHVKEVAQCPSCHIQLKEKEFVIH